MTNPNVMALYNITGGTWVKVLRVMLGRKLPAVQLPVWSERRCGVNDVLLCAGTLSTASGRSDERGSCAQRAL